jgi:hypothetical protein
MKRILLALVLALVVGFSVAPSAYAAPAYNTAFTVAITYQNVGSLPADITVDFFQEGSGTAINFPNGTLNAGASTSLSVGTAITSGSFKGSAVLSSNQPVIATIVQLDPAGVVRNRPLSNGFSATDGAPKQLVATVLKNMFDSTTYFSVQNVGGAAINVTVDCYAVGATTPTHTATATNLPASSAKYFDAGKIAELGASFNGSAVVRAKLASDNTTDANVVVTADELSTIDGGSKSFEGTALSSDKIFMPSAICNAFGGQFTAYAIQTADLANNVTFQVRYKQNFPAVAADVIQGPFTLAPGGKQSAAACGAGGMPAGTSGSAIIERTAGTGTLVAVGKVGGANITSAFLGIPSGAGSANVALPYIRWSPDAEINNNGRQRASVAIQNIGTTDATNVKVLYIDRDGVVKGTHNLGTIAPGGKISSNPKDAGALDACGRFGMYGAGGSTTDCNTVLFGGGAKVLADGGAQLAVIVRIFTGNPILAGEDYNGINVQ